MSIHSMCNQLIRFTGEHLTTLTTFSKIGNLLVLKLKVLTIVFKIFHPFCSTKLTHSYFTSSMYVYNVQYICNATYHTYNQLSASFVCFLNSMLCSAMLNSYLQIHNCLSMIALPNSVPLFMILSLLNFTFFNLQQ